ncbi:MAG: CHAT domain-containing protein [Acidobacteriota bacterium]
MRKKSVFRIAGLCVALILLTAIALTLRAPVSVFFFNRGLQAKRLWQLDVAISHFNRALSLNQNFSAARLEKALCLQQRGNFIEARQTLAAFAPEALEDPALQARWLNALGVNYFNTGEAEAAIESQARSLALAQELADRQLIAQILIDWGRVIYHLKGEPQQALDYLTQALEMGRALNDELIEADALRNIGAVKWWFQGELENPLTTYYEPALQIYWRHNQLRGTAITLCNISLIHLYKGDFFEFLKLQNESLELKRRIGDWAGLCDSYAFLGQAYNDWGNPRKASEFYSQSIALSRAGGYKLIPAEEALIAAISLQTGDYAQTLELLNRVLESEDQKSLVYKYTVARIGYAHLLNGDVEAAKTYLERALAIGRAAGSSDERFVVTLISLLGECHLKLGNLAEASALVEEADRFTLTELEEGRSINLTVLKAQLMNQQQRRREALNYLTEAAEIDARIFRTSDALPVVGQNQHTYDVIFNLLLESTTASKITPQPYSAEELTFRFLEQLRYRSLKNFVRQMSGRKTNAPLQSREEQQAVLKIRRLAEKLKREASAALRQELYKAYGEYEDLLLQNELNNPQYRLLREAKPLTLKEVRQSLDEKTALLQYFFIGNRTYALVITRAAVRALQLPITKVNLSAKIRLFRALLLSDSPTQPSMPQLAADDWQPVAIDLRQALITPIEQTGQLADTTRLGLIPFGAMHDLPFAALLRMDNRHQQFLIEDYTLFQTPTGSFLADALQRAPTQKLPQSLTMLSFGLNETDEPELLPLAYAAQEAEAVAQIFQGETRIGKAATESELAQLAPHFKYLHLATHAVSEPQMPLLSRLKLHSSPDSDGNLTVKEIFELGLQAELVTLGACQTGQSFSASGNEFADGDRIGLIDAFLRAGANSVFASLLPVSDRPTAEFMKTFYQNLRSLDKAEALAQTQRAMLKGNLTVVENHGNRPLTHPRYWSPFILVGNYR